MSGVTLGNSSLAPRIALQGSSSPTAPRDQGHSIQCTTATATPSKSA